MTVYYSKETLEVLKKNMNMSPETWHKVMNPFCGQEMLKRGQAFLETLKQGKKP